MYVFLEKEGGVECGEDIDEQAGRCDGQWGSVAAVRQIRAHESMHEVVVAEQVFEQSTERACLVDA